MSSAGHNKHKRESRLARLNERLRILVAYRDLHNLTDAREQAKRNGDIASLSFSTYTQAHKFLKSIPRDVREAYNHELAAENKAARSLLERQRKALRSTDQPSTQKESAKSKKEMKKTGRTT